MSVVNTIPFFSCFLHLSCAVILRTADAEALSERGALELTEMTILQFKAAAFFFLSKMVSANCCNVAYNQVNFRKIR